ncbi:MAG: hypothetical protein ACFFD4_23100 [Candidatus Odinarchaeota archaeon]
MSITIDNLMDRYDTTFTEPVNYSMMKYTIIQKLLPVDCIEINVTYLVKSYRDRYVLR